LNTIVDSLPNDEDVYSAKCRFCRSRLVWIEIDNLWQENEKAIAAYHEDLVECMEEQTDRRWVENNLEIIHCPELQHVCLAICPVCRWWLIDKELIFGTRGQVWTLHYGAAGTRPVPTNADLDLPIRLARQYLAADYSRRFEVSPRTFEMIVGSVLGSFGYPLRTTTWSHDEGIDILMIGHDGQLIGVQVKRQRRKIGSEQLRSFLGALLLTGCKRGVYVTTSQFSPACHKISMKAGELLLPLKLIDGEAFWELLKTAQIRDFESDDFSIEEVLPLSRTSLEIAFEHHLNSL
jgi:hypothetical protein